MNVHIITESDSRYFGLALDMIASVRAATFTLAWPWAAPTISVVDIGLTPEQASLLGAIGTRVVAVPTPPIGTRPWVSAGVHRGLIAELVPCSHGDVLVHLDADAWVQQPDALAELVRAAAANPGKIAAARERWRESIDFTFRDDEGSVFRVKQSEASSRAALRAETEEMFGRGAAELVDADWPGVNTGVYAHAHVPEIEPGLDAWRQHMLRAIATGKWRFVCDQQALMLAIVQGQIALEEVRPWSNFTLNAGLPYISGNRLTDADGLPAGIVHLCSLKKFGRLPLTRLDDGRVVAEPIRYLERLAR